MRFKLRNYTSESTVQSSLAKIEEYLVAMGASNVNKKYENGEVMAFIFQIRVPTSGLQTFRLPSNVQGVFKAMMADHKRPHRGTEKKVFEQAKRTAWAIMRDSISITLTQIAIEQRTVVQAFLAEMCDPEGEHTLYEIMQERGFKMLEAPKEKGRMKDGNVVIEVN